MRGSSSSRTRSQTLRRRLLTLDELKESADFRAAFCAGAKRAAGVGNSANVGCSVSAVSTTYGLGLADSSLLMVTREEAVSYT